MGLLFVLIVWAIGLSILASIAAAALWALTYSFTKGVGDARRKALVAAVLLPFLCIGYAGIWFVGYAVPNYTVFHRDPGLGDGWDTPLPNGYALTMIDVTDQGIVYNPKTSGGYGQLSGSGTLDGVRQPQIADHLIFGARDSGYFNRLGQTSNPNQVDTYFEINTKTNSRMEFKTLEELRQRAASDGVTLKLREFSSVFDDYRLTWFDWTAFALLLLVPSIAFLFFVRWVWRMRKASGSGFSELSAASASGS